MNNTEYKRSVWPFLFIGFFLYAGGLVGNATIGHELAGFLGAMIAFIPVAAGPSRSNEEVIRSLVKNGPDVPVYSLIISTWGWVQLGVWWPTVALVLAHFVISGAKETGHE